MSTIKPPPHGNATQAVPTRGGTEAAIQHHYDVSNAFYALWLDETLTYSCGLWRDGDDPDDLLAAQRRKIDYHLDAAGISRARHVLDIGCGWGSLLERAELRACGDRYRPHIERGAVPIYCRSRPHRPADSQGELDKPSASAQVRLDRVYRGIRAFCQSGR